MPDTDLHQRLVSLANAIRDVPTSKEHDEITQRFFAVVAHLESIDLIERGQWRLASRR